ncbi:anti-sigma regulatory factor [Alteromonas lipotrueiana]|uniref:anti-sigma regulatory factor n=1 Tax=Alteromonas lipotrueiana TaxID=2803815 RepID=UPI001C440584|nr:anti-sigma regulatory factor [Alteromonas lipotrueiana]
MLNSEYVPIKMEEDLLLVRKCVRQLASSVGFGVLDMTRLMTAAVELGRNTLIHGKGGHMRAVIVVKDKAKGIRLDFEDAGPGIPDLDLALTDGYTSKDGMGLGLSGAKRLVNEFTVIPVTPRGVRIIAISWLDE